MSSHMEANAPNMRNCTVGNQAHIEPNVMLGYKYTNWKEPLRLGDYPLIHSGAVIYSDTEIGNYFTCGHNVTIRAQCIIGDRVVILHGCTLEGKVIIGKGVKIMANVYIPSQTVIGNMVFIGPGTHFLNALFPMRKPGISGPKVGNNVVIGGGVTINPGVVIGDNVFVASGTTVIRDVPSNSLVYGCPGVNKSLPARFGKRNDPVQIFSGLDLWNGYRDDDSWRIEDFFGKEDWLSDSDNTRGINTK